MWDQTQDAKVTKEEIYLTPLTKGRITLITTNPLIWDNEIPMYLALFQRFNLKLRVTRKMDLF